MLEPALVERLKTPILLTGGSGYLGGRMVERLSELGVPFTAPIRRELDLSQWDSTDLYFAREKPATVLHLAGSVQGRRGCENLLQVYHSNTTAMVHVLEACRRHDVQRLVVTGTADETGSAASTDGLRRPEQPKEPRSVYAATKAAGTLFCEAFTRFSEVRPTVARLFAIYGPGQSTDFLLPSLLEALRTGQPLDMTGGTQQRDFVWLDDALDALLALAVESRAEGRTLDVCRGETVSLRDLVEMLSELSGRPVPARFGAEAYRPGEPFVIAGHPEPLRELIGDRLQTTLRQGLSRWLSDCGLLAGS